MTVERNSVQDASQHALKLVLAIAEDDMPTYFNLCREVDKRRGKFAEHVVRALCAITANSVKTAHPDSWNAFLRLNILDIQADPAAWAPDTKDTP